MQLHDGTIAMHALLLVASVLVTVVKAKHTLKVNPLRVEIEIGGSANITCTTDLCPDSRKLHFVEDDTGNPVPSTDIEIVDRKTIVYALKRAKAQDRNYKCKCGADAIGITHVSVGTPPVDVTDFRCRVFDYLYMVCNFTKPHNMVLTQYNLNYTTHSPDYINICKLDMYEHYGICNLTAANSYRYSNEFYNFTLTGSNVLGTNKQTFWINHFESVVPPRPEFHVTNIGKNSAELTWRLDRYSLYEKKGLQFDVRLRADNFEWQANSTYETGRSKAEFKVKLLHLPYPYYNYTVRLRLRVCSPSSCTSNITTEWGEVAERRFQTLGMRPQYAPATDEGSFYIGSSEPRVRLYWEQLPAHQENGANFHYVITQVKRDGEPIHLRALHMDRISATFPWNNTNRYEFTIQSRNDEGISINTSKIMVPLMPPQHERYSPQWIRNVYHAGNHTYTLSWTPPDIVTDLQDYTVFKCPSKRANTNECQGSISFKHLPRNSTSVSIAADNQEHTLNFAVSANHKHLTTGMHWTMCAVDGTSDVVKIEPECSTPFDGMILVQWVTDRICTSLTEGYNLSFCEVRHDSDGDCLGEKHTHTIDKMEKKFVLHHLKPFTKYKIQMYMYSKVKVGIESDPLYVTTREEAPTAPRDLRYHNITNTTAWISWLPPAQLNGHLRSYTVFVENNPPQEIDCEASANSANGAKQEEVFYQLRSLNSFTNYSVLVRAHTVAASLPSNHIHFTTKIGWPSSPGLAIGDRPSSIQWSKPEVPAGRVEFYEVEIAWKQRDIGRSHVSVIMGTGNATQSCNIKVPLCMNSNYNYTLKVRAVNVAPRSTAADSLLLSANATASSDDEFGDSGTGEESQLQCVGNALNAADRALMHSYHNANNYMLYKSAWQLVRTDVCGIDKASEQVLLVSFLLAGVLLALAMFFMLSYRKCKKMKDIHCIVPDGILNALKQNDIDNYSTKGNGYNNNESNGLLAKCNYGSSSEFGMSSGYTERSTDDCSLDTVNPPAIAINDDASMQRAMIKMPSAVDEKNTADMPVFASNGYVIPRASNAAGIALAACKTSHDLPLAISCIQNLNTPAYDRDGPNAERNYGSSGEVGYVERSADHYRLDAANNLGVPYNDTAYMQMSIATAAAEPRHDDKSATDMSLFAGDGYVHPSESAAASLAHAADKQQSMLPPNICYINSWKGAGIVPATNKTITNAPALDGYITVDAAGKFAPSAQSAALQEGSRMPMSGYVTPRELTQLGQPRNLYGGS